jgi:hypothetical protein
MLFRLARSRVPPSSFESANTEACSLPSRPVPAQNAESNQRVFRPIDEGLVRFLDAARDSRSVYPFPLAPHQLASDDEDDDCSGRYCDASSIEDGSDVCSGNGCAEGDADDADGCDNVYNSGGGYGVDVGTDADTGGAACVADAGGAGFIADAGADANAAAVARPAARDDSSHFFDLCSIRDAAAQKGSGLPSRTGCTMGVPKRILRDSLFPMRRRHSTLSSSPSRPSLPRAPDKSSSESTPVPPLPSLQCNQSPVCDAHGPASREAAVRLRDAVPSFPRPPSRRRRRIASIAAHFTSGCARSREGLTYHPHDCQADMTSSPAPQPVRQGSSCCKFPVFDNSLSSARWCASSGSNKPSVKSSMSRSTTGTTIESDTPNDVYGTRAEWNSFAGLRSRPLHALRITSHDSSSIDSSDGAELSRPPKQDAGAHRNRLYI